MARELRLGAALFNADHARLGAEVDRIEAAGVDFVHLDVFDGRLVRGIGFSARTVAALRPLSSLPFEVHLAAERPEDWLPDLAAAGVDLVLVHVEGPPMLYETLFSVREAGLLAGIAVGLATALDAVEAALPYVDSVLLLSRVTGEGTRGASFDARVLPRLATVRTLIDAADASIDLQVAGGINGSVLGDVVAAGVDSVALGAALYRSPDMRAEVGTLRAAAGART